MDRAEIVDLLTRLAGRLAERGVRGEMYVVGGAAIALAYDERRSTHDIDAVFEPRMVIYDEAAALATELDLQQGWLNDAVKGFLTGPDAEAVSILDLPGACCCHRLAPHPARTQGTGASDWRGRRGCPAAGACSRPDDRR